jgi:biotin carboxylase
VTRARPVLAVAYGPRSVPVMQLAEAAAGTCDLVWLVDGRIPEMATMSKLLSRFGPVVDTGGLDRADAARSVAAWKPDGLVTYFDAGMVELAELADDLGLDFHRPDTARALTDKAEQRRALAGAGLAGPPLWPLPPGPVGPALASLSPEPEWPVVIKPRSESGSRHTFLARDAGEAADLLGSVTGPLGAMVVEGYIPDDPTRAAGPYADYVSVETLVSAGRPTAVAITGRFPPAPTFRETGFLIPAVLSAEETALALELNRRAVAALGVRTGGLHTEIKFTPDGPVIIEVNGRLGGGIPDMLLRAAGVNLLERSMAVALGQESGCPEMVPCDRVGYRFFLQPPRLAGTVREVTGVDRISKHPGVDSVSLHRGPGSSVDWKEGTRTYILSVVGSAPDHEGVLEVDRILREELSVTYDTPGGRPGGAGGD